MGTQLGSAPVLCRPARAPFQLSGPPWNSEEEHVSGVGERFHLALAYHWASRIKRDSEAGDTTRVAVGAKSSISCEQRGLKRQVTRDESHVDHGEFTCVCFVSPLCRHGAERGTGLTEIAHNTHIHTERELCW